MQTAQRAHDRLKVFVREYRRYRAKRNQDRPLSILDIGCGQDAQLAKFKAAGDFYAGCDFFESVNVKLDDYRRIDLNEDKLSEKFAGQKFDVIFCGEVIEHLFSPDDLLKEMRELMGDESVLILSTPNLAYYLNRLMLLFGISPFFLENSSEVKLGRKLRILGQGNKTEGHIRVFTYGAMIDLIRKEKMKIIKVIGVPGPWSFWPDRAVSFFSRSLAAGNVFILKKADK